MDTQPTTNQSCKCNRVHSRVGAAMDGCDAGWQRLKNPDDFAAWEALLRFAESAGGSGGVTAASESGAIANLRSVFDGFLAKFPLCFGYWKKYCDAELRIEGAAKADEVFIFGGLVIFVIYHKKTFERAVAAIHNSIDLWIHYCQFKVDHEQDPDAVRAVFERAAQGIGHDFLSHTFWDKYIDFEETRQRNDANVLAILERVIRIPLHQYARYFEKYSALSVARPAVESIGQEEYNRLSAEIKASGDSKDVEKEIRQKIHTLKSEIYLKTQESVHKLWAFESEIKRPYFHIKPMDETQLANWRKYLDFEEASVDSGASELARLYVLYERCMVPCALYEEFWLRYARCLVVRGDLDGAKNVYYRAANLFLAAGRTELRLEYAAFEEEQGRIDEAGAVFAKLMDNVPGHVETLYKYAHYMRRNFGTDKADEVFTSAVGLAPDEKSKGFLIASHAKFVYATKESIEGARQFYQAALPSYTNSKSLLLQYFLFELNLPGNLDSLEPASVAWDAIKASDAFTTYEKLLYGNRYADFLNERAGDLVAHRALMQFLHANYRLPTSEEALGGGDGAGGSRKRGASGGDDDKAYKIAKTGNGAITPIVSAAIPQQYGGYGQQPVQQQQQWSQYGGGYGQGQW
ncbi:UNVERIFIED_CONTAM: hypothetical protein HDU68_001358 [Siphonaria sp. JEL0065]|nr:hypothetical protein HDU68_001358 [Siphonaria sp. JEL0065]